MRKLINLLVLICFVSCNFDNKKNITYKENILCVSNGVKDGLEISKIKISSVNPETNIPNSFKTFNKYILRTKSMRRYDSINDRFYYTNLNNKEIFKFSDTIILNKPNKGYYWEDEQGNSFKVLPLNIDDGSSYYIRGVYLNNLEEVLFINVGKNLTNINTVINESPI